MDKHLDHIAGNGTEWNYQTWKIDFTEDVGIGRKYITASGEAGAEIPPKDDACQIEQCLWGTVGRDSCQATEYKHVHYGGKEWLDKIPERTENGLLVLGDDIALDIHDVEIAIVPEAFEIDVEKTATRGDYVLLQVI